MMFSREQLQSAWNELPDRLKGTPFHRARTEGLTLKLETLQPTGSYKIRAAYRLLQKSESPGVALSSSGNFAGAFTWAAAQHGKEAHLVVTSSSPNSPALPVRYSLISFSCPSSFTNSATVIGS